MGIFQSFKRSFQKSKIMRKLIRRIDCKNNEYDSEEQDKTLKEFYDFIYNDCVLGELLKKYDMDFASFDKIFQCYLNNGCIGWQGTDYLPVALFSFKNPLEYILQNKDAFEGDHWGTEEIFYESKQKLYD